MIRLTTVLWLVLVAGVGYGMFQVKYEVMQLEEELARVNRQIVQGREAIHVLNAEWSFLNQPSRLDELAKRHLKLQPIGTAQLGRADALPHRPEDPAAAASAEPPALKPAPPVPAAAPPGSAAGTRFANANVKLRTE